MVNYTKMDMKNIFNEVDQDFLLRLYQTKAMAAKYRNYVRYDIF